MSSELSKLLPVSLYPVGLIANLQPTFPMQETPSCRRCGYTPKKRETVSFYNPNGNAGRPYYICIKCKMSKIDYARGWISWDDDRGVHPSNHNCDCGIVCRQDRAGKESSCPGRGFWTCASGSCGYLSYRTDGLTDNEAEDAGAAPDPGFEPWLF